MAGLTKRLTDVSSYLSLNYGLMNYRTCIFLQRRSGSMKMAVKLPLTGTTQLFLLIISVTLSQKISL